MVFTRRSGALGALLLAAVIAAFTAGRTPVSPAVDAPDSAAVERSVPGMPWSTTICRM